MQKDSKFLDDIAKIASGTAGGILEMKREMDTAIHAQVEKWLQSMNLVTREEFDAVQAMLAKARAEQEQLKARLQALETLISGQSKG